MSVCYSNEIDEDLLIYIRSLIRTERLRGGGPTNVAVNDLSNSDDVLLPQTQRDTIKVLKSIHRVLEAELAMENNPNLRFLGRLLFEKSEEVFLNNASK